MIRCFTDLEVWQRGRELRQEISDLVAGFPGHEKYRLCDQLIRASRSVTNNIAEGFGRFHYKENIQFCRQSRGSLFEIHDHLIIALDEGYIDKEALDKTRKLIDTTGKLLNGYINSTQKMVNNS